GHGLRPLRRPARAAERRGRAGPLPLRHHPRARRGGGRPVNRPTRIAHSASVGLMGALVLVATADGFAQSYAGLHRWALAQGLTGWKAESFPLLVDLFILVGELGLFTLALEGHRLTRRGLSWADAALPFGLAAAGWGVSLAFNVGAVAGWERQVTAAVAPVASMLGLLVLLRTVHRLITRT